MIVFVYGTLKEGKYNHHFLDGAEPLGEARTTKDYSLQIDSLPFMQKVPGKGVVGELYRIDDAILERLDYLEGHPRFYTRCPIILQDGGACIAYLYNGPLSEQAQWDVEEYK